MSTNWRIPRTNTSGNLFPEWKSAGDRALAAGLAGVLHILRDDFVELLSLFGAGQLLNMGQEKRVLSLLTQLFQEGLDLGIDEEHLSAEAGFEKEIFVQDVMAHERTCQTPIAQHLAKPGVFRGTAGAHHLEDVVSAFRPEGSGPPLASFAKLRFAAGVVELENEFCVG